MSDKEFWQAVYVAAVASGRCRGDAAAQADAALEEQDERWDEENEGTE